MKKSHQQKLMTFFHGASGIRTHVPKKDNRISSAARYDHFDIAPGASDCQPEIFYHKIKKSTRSNFGVFVTNGSQKEADRTDAAGCMNFM